MRFKPYAKAKFILMSTMHFEEWIHHEFTLDLDEFMINIFGEWVLYDNYYLCFNFGW